MSFAGFVVENPDKFTAEVDILAPDFCGNFEGIFNKFEKAVKNYRS